MSVLDLPNVTKNSESAYEVAIHDVTGAVVGTWMVDAYNSWTSWQVMWLPDGASMFAGYPGEPKYPWEGDFRSAEAAVEWCLNEGAR